MLSDKLKKQFSELAAAVFRETYPRVFETAGREQVFSESFIRDNLEKPKDPRMGRFAFPVFRFSKMLGEQPDDIATKLSRSINLKLEQAHPGSALSTEAVGGFINARIEFGHEARETIMTVLDNGESYGSSDEGQGRKVLVEYCSANIAKPFMISHLRTTILGNALRRIFRKLGYDAIGINYLGDWGTQFGKMIVAFRKWGATKPSGKETVTDLADLYVRFHREAELDASLDEQARQAFRLLEDGDPETTQLWQRFKDISLAEFNRVFELMGIEFDWITGEAFLNDKMEPVIERLRNAGLTSESDGALIVDLKDPQLPPCLLKKADGATLYATRDIAGLLYRWDKYRFHQALYVVASAQSDHFRQVFKVVAMLEDAESVNVANRVAPRAKHIEFGLIKFGDKAMATRLGNIVVLDDVVNQACQLARQKIHDKNPQLEKIDETALMIGVGAVIFSQLSVRRQKDVSLDWDEVLNFEGETGPYLQYTHARLRSLIRNYGKRISADIDPAMLNNEEERRVVELLADFPQTVLDAAANYEPNHISVHLLKLAGSFNKVYQRKLKDGRIDKIISDDDSLSAARMAMVGAVQIVVREGLYLLGIKAPEEM